MFRTVRHWWSEGSGQHTARLFLFELFVVIAGVLIAQGLASWMADRAALADMEQGRAALREQVAENASTAEAWQVAAQCLDDRVALIMRRLAAGPLDPGMSDRPVLDSFQSLALSERSFGLLRDRHGSQEASDFENTRRQVEFSNARIQRIVSEWGRLTLADPLNGRPTQFDRDQARLAAADIRGELRALKVGSADLASTAHAMGIGVPSQAGLRPVRDCAQMWAAKAISVRR
ncbi:hypothetical protein ABDK56_08775 [Sphingomonas sp. ASV193]|uniref:hypothetical protein n=1 Tax=Sphingomonas sp. ASV193 TaxID=3144405 RepID=UPI0032E87048